MTTAVLIFQAFVIFTILVTRIVATDKLVLVSIAWTIFTLAMVFATPLVLLQLAVIWVTYSIVAPKHRPDEPNFLPPPASPPAKLHSHKATSGSRAQNKGSPAISLSQGTRKSPSKQTSDKQSWQSAAARLSTQTKYSNMENANRVAILKSLGQDQAVRIIERFQPVSESLLERYVEHWDWGALSSNPDLPWSVELIERYEKRWDWSSVSLNPGLPWSVELLERYKDRWVWSSLSLNRGLPWSVELLKLYKERWTWGDRGLSLNPGLPWSVELLEKYKDRWKWDHLSDNESLPWSLDLLERYKEYWDWSSISLNPGLPWSVELIERYKERWEWGDSGLPLNPGLPWSRELIERYNDRWKWEHLCQNSGVPWSVETLERHKERLDWPTLSRNKGLAWSLDLLERYKERWDWSSLSLNAGLPWSVELLERYKNRWRWQAFSRNKFWAFLRLQDFDIIEIMEKANRPKADTKTQPLPSIYLAPHSIDERAKPPRSDGFQFGSREIGHLVHFTQAENLASIMQNGILSVSSLRRRGISFRQNDISRYDYQINASSLSITHPNEKLFYKWRMEDPSQDWVVLLIESSILRRRDLAFNIHNAADKRMSSRPLSARKGVDAFEGMFAEIDGFAKRAELGLRDQDTTDVQAEVLAFQKIEPRLILGAVFDSLGAMARYSNILGNRDISCVQPNTGLFGVREYNYGLVRSPFRHTGSRTNSGNLGDDIQF
ncbi:DarT ssDNA thymidine ADP-ribosyltransferase family protein [Erythrobacter sp. SD-21]|uniref:DarT ssDNA thymidine ADP-ribosyltransferase family protein n=1 Tax=Erythrobacter sp. SD-21 TaxID=161528 RepID=UPI000153F0BD|nr:DarT ssDNA thymidine ADP-ribosyltransferase family protein [Erythrobacter sp. SD-21]EDL48243.1 hypothetical protein ED21_31869 [Erythrobacter sp. SD-21]